MNQAQENFISAIFKVLFCCVFILISSSLFAEQGNNDQTFVVNDQNKVKEAGYLVVAGWYKDSAVAQEYTKTIGPILDEHGRQASRIGLPGLNLNVLEGPWIARNTILIKFEDVANIKEFWWSDDYREAKKIRDNNSVLDVIGVKAVAGVNGEMSDESALLMFHATITDREKLLSDYVKDARSIVHKHGGKYIIRSTRSKLESLEGDWHNASLIVLEFPSSDSLRAFWNDEEYKRLSEIRKTTGKWSVIEILPLPKQP